MFALKSVVFVCKFLWRVSKRENFETFEKTAQKRERRVSNHLQSSLFNNEQTLKRRINAKRTHEKREHARKHHHAE